MLAPILEQGCSESINPQMHESYMDTVSNHYVILCIHILDIQLQANNALKTNHQRPSTQLIKVATSVGNDGNWWDLDLLSHGKRARVQLLHTSWHYSVYVIYVHSDQHIMCTVLIPDIICIRYVYIIQPVYAWICMNVLTLTRVSALNEAVNKCQRSPRGWPSCPFSSHPKSLQTALCSRQCPKQKVSHWGVNACSCWASSFVRRMQTS